MALILRCDDASLVVELARLAEEIGLSLSAEVVADPFAADADAIAVLGDVDPQDLARLSKPTALALLGVSPSVRDLATDLGHPTVAELRPLVSALALRGTSVHAWTASTKALEAVDRNRLASVVRGPRGDHRLVPADHGRLALEADGSLHDVGEGRDVALALAALKAAQREVRPTMPRVDGVDPQQVLDVILGPPRVLSDPASKAALSVYDVPLPLEELCASPSRAAFEASRIGFPVRIALASPDLRIADHPDLATGRVHNAARVRDVFRQIMTLAKERNDAARVLGVTVSATSASIASLWVRARALGDGLVAAEIGFADPHGRSANDETATVLPCRSDDLERALS
ncbi:MAG: acetate--CoA ligase family protein, partial [Myxococcota bacterium]